MDIDTTQHDTRPAMQLDLPASDDVMMEVEPDLAAMTSPAQDPHNPHALSPLLSSPRILDASLSASRAVPLPPVVLITSSDLTAWPKFKLDQLFVEWLARPDSKIWLDTLLDDARTANPSDSLAAAHATRTRLERAMSVTPSRSPTSSLATPNATQTPGSPVSRLFSTHVPFGDTDSSPKSPPSTPSATVSPFRPSLNSPLAADFDLGRSGSASPLATLPTPLDIQSTRTPTKGTPSEKAAPVTPNASANTSDQPSKSSPTVAAHTEQVPDSKALDSVADGIAGMRAVVDIPQTGDVSPTQMKIDYPLESPKKSADDQMTTVPSMNNDLQPSINQQPEYSSGAETLKPTSDAQAQPIELISQHEAETAPVSDNSTVNSSTTTLVAGLYSEGVKSIHQSIASASPSLANASNSAQPTQTMVQETKDESGMVDHAERTAPAPPPSNDVKPPTKDDSAMTKPARKRTTLPKFYFPCGKDAEAREKRERDTASEIFKAQRTQKNSAGVTRSEIVELVVEVIGLPTYFANIVFNVIQELYPPSAVETDAKMSPVEKQDMAIDGTNRTSPDAVRKTPNPGFDQLQGDGVAANQRHKNSNDGANSDTTMGDVEDSRSAEDKQANGFHSASRDQGITSGASVPEASAPLENPRTQPVETAGEVISEAQFVAYYNAMCAGRTKEARLFFALLEPGAKRNYLIPNDFKPLLRALLMCHQGLAFLHATPEFQQRYSETVIERIYFGCTRQHNGRLTLQDINRSKLLDTLMVVDEEEDINRERKYFSYEHFYVLYCRFWELDANHDLQIDREDLMRYGGHSLTYRIVDRIFGGYARPLDSPDNPGFMSYTDFIWFCLSEEDKTSDTAIDYWFRCVDMDGDGLITMYDMEFFYKEQLHRMECFGHEPVQIRDILCQLLDMIKPSVNPPVIRRRDLKRCRLAGNFFNVLFNLNKFFAIEARDPLQIRQEHATPELTDWDRFAALEYLRLSAEEEGEEDESWEDVGEASNPLIAGEAPF